MDSDNVFHLFIVLCPVSSAFILYLLFINMIILIIIDKDIILNWDDDIWMVVCLQRSYCYEEGD